MAFCIRTWRLPLIISSLLMSSAATATFAATDYRQLTELSAKWRTFEPPAVKACAPDYSASAMAEKARGLADFQQKLTAIDTAGWTTAQIGDAKLVAAEMNGMDFDLRVLKPWARDPSFYASVWGEDSDVPEHEGPSIFPIIDLQTYRYPLSKADQKTLTCQIGAIPAILEQAKINLRDSNARDLWVYGTRAFREQSATLAALQDGTLDMRTLEGRVHGSLKGADKALITAVAKAKAATDAFQQWLDAEAPSKTGPSGVGKDNYDWYMKNVHLVPYTWAEQETLLKRELERSRASLALEEYRNRNLPQLDPVNDPDAYMAMAKTKMRTLTDFLIKGGLVDDQPYYREAMANQVGAYTPPEKRNFFSHGMALDPSGLFSHDYHWIELARRKHEPNASQIRANVPLYDMYDSRSEGMATAVEELLLHAGLYDDTPRSREIVWIMLANRAARGLASLYVQSNDMTLREAGEFHARWTPRKWSDPDSDLVGFEQLLYLRQPGYGTSYITGKLELDRLMSEYSFEMEKEGKPFSLPDFFTKMNASGVIPFPLIEADMIRAPLRVETKASAQ
ncbi:DUF885 family protein [Asticcacaulis sp. 201]|uniref:DUF885 family protein n=1 Tax=Asticcacaulis sp. 201 TaxID=3028787 RepID=UPI002916695A|nr:DUF885 family protein [Asticcacaulis sp. 201]MDV6331175.1 DUF885 family protein [Asticcacaulis sp. 201]